MQENTVSITSNIKRFVWQLCSLIGHSYFYAISQPVFEMKVRFAALAWLPLVHEIESKVDAEFKYIAKLNPFIELRLQLDIV